MDNVDQSVLGDIDKFRREFTAFLMRYKFGIDEILTKIEILREEFTHHHEYNPIEHVTHRLKSMESLTDKMVRLNVPLDFQHIQSEIRDIAGIRITCSFVSDVYRVKELITSQADVKVLTVKDYIAKPKDNGYQSLHAIVEVPVFLSTGETRVPVELQIRTIAMDFWASLEHKIYYKFNREVPPDLIASLKLAADTAAALDTTMENLHEQVKTLHAQSPDSPDDEAKRRLAKLRTLMNDRWSITPAAIR